MTGEMLVPGWMHEQVTVEQYAAWTTEQCAGTEIVDGMVLVSPSSSQRHHRPARLLANALDPATGRYRDSEVFTGVVKLAAPFAVEVDLGQL
jgi:hypothetical protein